MKYHLSNPKSSITFLYFIAYKIDMENINYNVFPCTTWFSVPLFMPDLHHWLISSSRNLRASRKSSVRRSKRGLFR